MIHLEKRYIVHLGKLFTKHLQTFLSLKDTFVSDSNSCKIRKIRVWIQVFFKACWWLFAENKELYIIASITVSDIMTVYFLTLKTKLHCIIVTSQSKRVHLGVHNLLWKCAFCTIKGSCRLHTFTFNYVHPSGPFCLVRSQLLLCNMDNK